jgi:hypothetical protein
MGIGGSRFLFDLFCERLSFNISTLVAMATEVMVAMLLHIVLQNSCRRAAVESRRIIQLHTVETIDCLLTVDVILFKGKH